MHLKSLDAVDAVDVLFLDFFAGRGLPGRHLTESPPKDLSRNRKFHLETVKAQKMEDIDDDPERQNTAGKAIHNNLDPRADMRESRSHKRIFQQLTQTSFKSIFSSSFWDSNVHPHHPLPRAVLCLLYHRSC